MTSWKTIRYLTVKAVVGIKLSWQQMIVLIWLLFSRLSLVCVWFFALVCGYNARFVLESCIHFLLCSHDTPQSVK